MKHIVYGFLVATFVFGWDSGHSLYGQSTAADTSGSGQEPVLAFYPLLFYFPETRLGFGAAGVYNYYPGALKSKRPSQWQLGAAYTLNRQILLYASYQYFLADNQYELFGELGYYDYFYFYYGIGNDTDFNAEETYFVRFPRLRFNGLQRIVPNWRAGFSYSFDDYRIYKRQAGGLLDAGGPTGRAGGIISTLGLITRYDTRDNINLPRRGSLLTFRWEQNARWLGSDFSYRRLLVDAIHYIPLAEKSVLALNLYTGVLSGDPPFQELLFLGGPRKARGIVEGRYRDRSLILLQGAYRFPLFWRFRGVVFSSLGRVAGRYGGLWAAPFHWNYGTGLRFLLDEEEQIQIRLDVGLGSDRPGYYLTIGEAF